MKRLAVFCWLVWAAGASATRADPETPFTPPAPATSNFLVRDEAAVGAVVGASFHTTYIRLGTRSAEGLLYDPSSGTASRTALIYLHPNGNTFDEVVGVQMASRGYRTLMVNHHGPEEADDAYATSISRGVAFLRTLPGVERVVLVAHSGGGHVAAFYQNVAENGPAACNGPEKIQPCREDLVRDLAKADGLILLDPTLGAFHQMSSIDPALTAAGREPALDMFDSANGYDPTTRRAAYSPDFVQAFHAGQAVRNTEIVTQALARRDAVSHRQGAYRDDEPLLIPSMGVGPAGARLYQTDPRLLARTRAAHLLLGADGQDSMGIILSVRPSTGPQAMAAQPSLAMTQDTTVNRFLGMSAIRTLPGFAITDDDITGVDWPSAISSTPANAAGVTVPTLVLTMSCHYLVVPGEIVFNHLAASDRTYASVEGATHLFAPCRPQYGDTMKRTFDYLGTWLGKEGRF